MLILYRNKWREFVAFDGAARRLVNAAIGVGSAFGAFAFAYLMKRLITEGSAGAPLVWCVCRIHCSFAPSIWRRLLMQALRGPVRRIGRKSGREMKTITSDDAAIVRINRSLNLADADMVVD